MDGSRPAASQASAELAELGQDVAPAVDRHPAVAVLRDMAERHRPAGAAHDHRRLADRLRPRPARREADVLALERTGFLGPELLHGQHLLPHDLPTLRGIDAVLLHLVDVPADTDAEQEPSVAREVERGDGLGQHDGIVLGDEADAGAQLQALGHTATRRPAPRTDRGCGDSDRAAARRPATGWCGTRGCGCARGTRATRSPAASASRASAAGPIVRSVGKITTPSSMAAMATPSRPGRAGR